MKRKRFIKLLMANGVPDFGISMSPRRARIQAQGVINQHRRFDKKDLPFWEDVHRQFARVYSMDYENCYLFLSHTKMCIKGLTEIFYGPSDDDPIVTTEKPKNEQ